MLDCLLARSSKAPEGTHTCLGPSRYRRAPSSRFGKLLFVHDTGTALCSVLLLGDQTLSSTAPTPYGSWNSRSKSGQSRTACGRWDGFRKRQAFLDSIPQTNKAKTFGEKQDYPYKFWSLGSQAVPSLLSFRLHLLVFRRRTPAEYYRRRGDDRRPPPLAITRYR